MSKKQQQERKKKAKERETKAKLLARKLALVKQKKRDREVDRDVRAMRDRIVPIINPDKDKLRKQKQLERNLQMLKALEEEYKKEQEIWARMNKKLEEQGALTLQEKMDMMGKEATELAEKAETLVEKTNKVLSKVRGKEILQGQMMKENWEKRRKTFRDTLAEEKPAPEINENSEEDTKVSVE